MSYTPATTETIAKPDEVAKNVARLRLRGADDPASTKYAAYIPVWDKTVYPDWEEVPYIDAGSRGTKDKRHLFNAESKHRPITPNLGEEIHGVQLSQLTKEGLDDLALLAAERGLLVFRDQDFKDIGPERQLELVRHFGRLHIHPGHPQGYPEMHVVYRDPNDSTIARYVKPNDVPSITSAAFHIDHTTEIQPPGVTFFFALETPEAGGDTLFVSLTEAYKRLSDEFKKRLDGLLVVRDNTPMIENSKSLGGPARFTPQNRTHPLIRTHPVTGEKILYIERGFSRRIYGYKKEESDNPFEFLNDVIAKGADFQARAKYEPGTVVVWDNRVVAHTALYDFKGDERRHMIRIAAMADVPA